MRLSNIAHLYVVRLKARIVLVQELFAVLGIAVGVALLFASQVASTSLDASVAQLDSGVVGRSAFQLKARGPAGFDMSVLPEVHRLAGVSAVVPVLEREANLSGPAGHRAVDLIATDPRDVHFTGRLLRRFSTVQLADKQVLALPTPVASALGVGTLETLGLQVGAKSVRALVGAELTARTIGPLVNTPIALATLAYAQKLTAMKGRITRLLVQVRPGANARVRAELTKIAPSNVNVEPADYEASLFRQAAAPVDQSTKTFAAICALVGFMFAFCAMLLTMDLRKGLVRELRRGGATRWEAIKTLLFDAVVLATIASILGIALGDALSMVIFSSPPGFLSFAFPIGSQRIITWQSVVIAVGAGMVAACVGVLSPLRTVWSRPGEAQQRVYTPVSWGIVGLVFGACACLGVTTLILIFAPQSAVIGVVALIIALVLSLPPLLASMLAGFDRLQRKVGASATEIATVELRAPQTRTRSMAIAATAAVAVFASVTIEGSHANLQNGLDRVFRDVGKTTDLWVVPRNAQDLLFTIPFHGVPAAALAKLPGVRTVGMYRAGFLEYGNRRVWVLAPPPTQSAFIPAGQLIAGDARLADSRIRAGGWVAISKAVAEEHDLHIGQAFVLPTPNATTFRVAALTTNLGWPPGTVILNSNDFAHSWESADPSAYSVALEAGASSASVGREITSALGPGTGLAVETAAQREGAQRTSSRQGLGRLTQIAALVLVTAVLATAAVMGAAIWQRRRRFARMKVEGYETRTLWHALIWESMLLIGTGCLIGACLGIYGQLLLSHALVTVTGFPLVYASNVAIGVFIFALVTFVAAACIAIPGYRAAGVAPYPWPDD